MAEVNGERPTTVRVGVTYTHNMGNFESLKMEVTVEADSLPGEKAGTAIDRVHGLVTRKLEEKMQEAIKELAGKE